MTFRELVLTALRRWYVLLVVLLCATLLMLHFAQGRGAFTTRTSIDFTYPNSSALDPYNGSGDKSVIAFVAAVAQRVTGGNVDAAYGDISAPYYGAGIRQGVNVSLPNDGNQFVAIYRTARIDIQIVGPSYAWVQVKQQDMVANVLKVAETLQSDAGVSPSDQMVPTVKPSSLLISSIDPPRSTLVLAVGGMGIAALLVGGWSVTAFERLRSRPRPDGRPAAQSDPYRPTKELTQ